MLDMKLILNDTQAVKDAIHKREMNLDDTVDAIVQLDAQRRELIGNVEKMKAERNACSKKIPQMKKAGDYSTELMASMKKLADTIKEQDAKLASLQEELQNLMYSLPNLPGNDVQAGKEQNIPDHTFGEKPQFSFTPKNHVDLCESLGLIDYERGAKLGGNGAWIYRGMGSRGMGAFELLYQRTSG